MIALATCLMPSVARAENAFANITAPVKVKAAYGTSPSYSRPYIQEMNARTIAAWKRSLLPVIASQTLDIASSYGMRELNPALAGTDGRFGAKAGAMKISTTAAVIGIEYLVVKKWPGSAKMLSKLNWGSAALTGVFAAHNYAIK
jgi:hypothetical protein